MKALNRFFCGLFICALLFSCCVPSAFAEPIDSARRCSLSLQVACNGKAIPSMPFSLYRVADVSGEFADFTLVAPFDGYPISVDDLSAEAWRMLATTLDSYVRADQPTAYAEGQSDSSGKLVFDDLPCGLYFLLAEPVIVDDYRYEAASFMICLPNLVSGAWTYDAFAKPKLTEKPEMTFMSLRVLKIWDDFGQEFNRPAQIAVSLLCDGEVYDRVILTEKNSWRWHWDELEGGHIWTVTEEPLEDYSVTIELIDDCYCITNHAKPVPSPSPTPTPRPSPNKLPQTGLNWWPVVGFGAAGLLLFVLSGLAKRADRRKEDE